MPALKQSGNSVRAATVAALTLAAMLILTTVLILLLAPAGLAAPSRSLRRSAPLPLGQTILVPVDHLRPQLGQFPLYYELGRPFDRAKPTVLIIADAQQFYVRRGAVAGLQQTLFGDAFNVVGIVPRSTSRRLIAATLDSHGRPDWVKSWRLFNSRQFVADIDSVRKAVVGTQGKILLYGESGGGFLTHQYLAEYGSDVTRAFTPAALNPFLEGEIGLNSDHFWQELGASDPSLQPLLQTALQQHVRDRATLAMTFQRQNFFESPDHIAAARADLIRALAAGDTARYEAAQTRYQVPEVSKFLDSPEGIPIRVRLYEFFSPSHALARLRGGGFFPDLENQYNFAKPLIILHDAGKVPQPTFDFTPLHHLSTEMFVLAGRQDHTADYRSLIALAECYPRHILFIANDNHTFTEMKADGSEVRVLRAFLKFGLNSAELHQALSAAEPHRWREP